MTHTDMAAVGAMFGLIVFAVMVVVRMCDPR